MIRDHPAGGQKSCGIADRRPFSHTCGRAHSNPSAPMLSPLFLILATLLCGQASGALVPLPPLPSFVGTLGIATAAIEIFSRLPPQLVYRRPLPSFPDFNESHVFVVFPGAGGPDANTAALLQSVHEGDHKQKLQRFSFVFDWSAWRGNLFRAAFDSQAVGISIADYFLRTKPQLTHIHVVGISVGAFAADSFVREIKSKNSKVKTQLTLLDPFCSRGVFHQNYGINYFGREADFCEHFLNTDDPVPFTNDPLRHAHVFDVTHTAARASFTPLPNDNMHSWPGTTQPSHI